MIAYDYDRQKWVEGDEARALRRRQLIEERELIAGPEGENYLRATGRQETPHQAMSIIDTLLEDL